VGTWLERLGLFARAPDARPLSEIAADIEAELAFHVEETTQELVAGGMTANVARAEALRRFGDYERIRRECARTQMGERIMMQRIQVVLTAVLIAAVGLMMWSNHEARASMAAERAASTALIARIEAQLAGRLAKQDGATPPMSSPAVAYVEQVPMRPGEYLDENGKTVDRASASLTWVLEFQKDSESWRHGLSVAVRLAALPGTQGVEILSDVYPSLSVAHREQVFKPFVFDGGRPQAVEVLALGMADEASSVRERAAFYLETYAWKDLLVGDGTAEAWLMEWRDRPVADVLRANASRWAREYADLAAIAAPMRADAAARLLPIVDHVSLDTFAKAGVDLGAVLRENDVDRVSDEQAAVLSPHDRARAAIVRTWCRAK